MRDDGRRSYRQAGSLSLVSSGLILTWAIVSWLRHGQFDAAASSVFAGDPDSDTTVWYLQLAYLLGPGLSVAFAFYFVGAALACFNGRSYSWLIAGLGGFAVMPLLLATYVDGGRFYLRGTGANPILENQRFASLTSWRFAGSFAFFGKLSAAMLVIMLAAATVFAIRGRRLSRSHT
jgi:hypothetical protein